MKLFRYLVGIVSGLTFGMLFAPRKGKDLRDEIMKKSGDGAALEQIKSLGIAFQKAGEELYAELSKLSDHKEIRAFMKETEMKMHSFLSGAREKGIEMSEILEEKVVKEGKAVGKKLSARGKKMKSVMVDSVRSAGKSVKKKVSRVQSRVKKSFKR